MVDYERRARVAPNHTMTHVMNFALKKVLRGAGSVLYAHDVVGAGTLWGFR
jgi:alanyl-tRNA synthetase